MSKSWTALSDIASATIGKCVQTSSILDFLFSDCPGIDNSRTFSGGRSALPASPPWAGPHLRITSPAPCRATFLELGAAILLRQSRRRNGLRRASFPPLDLRVGQIPVRVKIPGLFQRPFNINNGGHDVHPDLPTRRLPP